MLYKLHLKMEWGCEMSLHRRKLIRHVNSVIPNSGIAKSVMPGVVDVRPTVPDAE